MFAIQSKREGESDPPMHHDRNTEDRLLRRRRCRSWPRHSRSGQPSLRIEMNLLMKAEIPEKVTYRM